MENKAKITEDLEKIEKIFQATMKKLNNLHRQKMDLIERFYKLDNNKELEKVRSSLKK